MSAVKIVDLEGNRVGEVELDDRIFAAPLREHLLWEVVTAQRAARRRGTAAVKGRSAVRGSSRKLYRQKGTGRARHGAARAPIYVGGGVAFGPQPRSYAKRTPKKVRRAALITALSLRASADDLVVVEDFKLGEIKTKRMAAILEKLGVKSSLIVDEATNDDLIKSVRNLASSKYLPPQGVNVYDILRHQKLVMTVPAVRSIQERLG